MTYIEPANSTGEVEGIRKRNFWWSANLAKRSRTFINVVRYVRNDEEFYVFFFFFSVKSCILLNISRFHYSKARAFVLRFAYVWTSWGEDRPPPLKTALGEDSLG